MAQGLTVDREFVDNDVSASKGTRPAFTQLLSLVKAGEVSTIVVWHTDRLYRRVRDLVDIVEMAEKHALRVLTVRAGDLDLSTPAGRMLAGMLGHAARYEVEQKGARQVASNIQRANAGHWQFSNRPYGYERIEKQVRVVESEAMVLREAYARYLAGETYYSIVTSLNERGIPTITGREWSITQLRSRLANPAYAGIREYKGEVVATGNWEPIISMETWESFKATTSRRKTPHTWSNRTKYLLSGIAVCAVCTNRMMARPDYPRAKDGVRQPARIAYACTSNWCVQRNQERVDELVEGVLVARLGMSDAAELIKPRADIGPLLRESGELRQRKDDLASALAEGLLSLTAVRTESSKLAKRIESLQTQISAADGDIQLVELVQSSDIETYWRTKMTLAQQRGVIGALMTVTINKQKNTRVFDPNDVSIDWLA